MRHSKALLRGKFIAMCAYIKSTERSKKNDLLLQQKLLKKQEQARSKKSRRKEIIPIRTKNTIQRINETKSWFTGKINMIDKPLANLTKIKEEHNNIFKVRQHMITMYPK
jgi:hypothetical protein